MSSPPIRTPTPRSTSRPETPEERLRENIRATKEELSIGFQNIQDKFVSAGQSIKRFFSKRDAVECPTVTHVETQSETIEYPDPERVSYVETIVHEPIVQQTTTVETETLEHYEPHSVEKREMEHYEHH
ncbi:hypothetical protein RCL1_001274 [Eukaryota sp. TZLM3-RCL]